jgi:hypothetical protein
MGNIIPTQVRTIDPYSSYDSNVVNRLTRMLTEGENALYGGPLTLNPTIDPATPTSKLLLSPGIVFKDDVLIQVTDEFSIDMHDSDFYLTTNHFDEVGYYYIVVKYTYVKAKPAPVVEIKIIKPSEHPAGLPSSGYFFLKAIYVDFIDGVFEIVSVHDFDPLLPSVKRIYITRYGATIYVTLPTWQESDEAQIIYVLDEDSFYYGTNSEWIKMNAGFNFVKDTLSGADWISSSSLYYGDVDISLIHSNDIVVECYNSANKKISPYDVESVGLDTVRIWMPTNSVTVYVKVAGLEPD